MICTIWSGPQRGIYIGPQKRRTHFTKPDSEIAIEIDGKKCVTSLSPSFWRNCPEIRVARDKSGNNVLQNWIKNNGLLPLGESIRKKGVKDTVILEVIEPHKRFKLYMNKRIENRIALSTSV